MRTPLFKKYNTFETREVYLKLHTIWVQGSVLLY